MMGAFWQNRPKMKHNITIYGVYVMPDYRGTGFAGQIFDTLLAEIKAIGQFIRVELTVNTEQVAAVIHEAGKYVAAEQILPCTNCGMAPLPRDLALKKLQALGAGARLAAGKG